MLPQNSEPGLITYHFLSFAAQHFFTSDQWKAHASYFLSEMNRYSGSDFSEILECRFTLDEKGGRIEKINSWNSEGDLIHDNLLSHCCMENMQRWASLLFNGSPVTWASTGTDSFWPDELESHGLKAYAAFPVFINGSFWGLISLEFRKSAKTWNLPELKIMQEVSGLLGRAIDKEQAGLALLSDKVYYEELFHSSPAAIVILNRYGIVERINKEFSRLFQYTPDEIVGKKIDHLLPSEQDKEKAYELIGKVMDGERVAHEGIRYRKDGSPVYVSIFGVQSVLDEKEPIVYKIYHDISERVLAQEKLHESQTRFRLLFESANDAIFLLKDGYVVECNARTLDIFKCRKEEIIGKSAIELSPPVQPDGSSSLKQAIRYFKTARELQQQSFEWQHQRPDGSRFIADVSINVFNWKNEQYTQAIVRDISSRKHTEELLKKRYDFIAFLSKISADFINLDYSQISGTINEVLGYSGFYTHCSRALVYLLNPESMLLHLAYSWKSGKKDPPSALETILVRDLSKSYEVVSRGEILIREVDPDSTCSEEHLLTEILDVAGFASYILMPLSAGGKFIGFTGYFTDKHANTWTDDLVIPLKVTNQMIANAIERIRIEDELNDTRVKAVESDRLKTAFLSSMSHEIRTPMNHILGFIELLKDPGLSDAEKNEFMSIVKSSGNMLLKLIDDIIDIAKLESGQLVINMSEVQIDKFVEDTYHAFNEQLKSSGKGKIDFRLFRPHKPAVNLIRTDPLRLQQILNNLLSNALKFTQEGTISLGYSIRPGNRLYLFVEDSGIGIPIEKHTEVFERFRQLDGSYAREYSGTGLGLTISKGLVELMNGEIGLESDIGKGSKFFFTIPFTEVVSGKESLDVAVLPRGEHDFSGKSILVVEDDEINYRFLEIVILKTRANVTRAISGKEAIDLAIEQNFDLVLMDIQIPHIDGNKATIEIKKQKPFLPVIAHTAHALPEERARCFEAGADDYLAKPISRKNLLNKLSEFLYPE